MCSEPQPEDHVHPIQQHPGRQGICGLPIPPRTSSNPSTSYKWIAVNPIPQNLLQRPQCDCQTLWDASPPTAQQNHTSLSDIRAKLWSFPHGRTKLNPNHYATMAGMISLSHVHINFFIPVKKQGKFWVFPDMISVMISAECILSQIPLILLKSWRELSQFLPVKALWQNMPTQML